MTLIVASNMPAAHQRDAVERALGRPLVGARALWVANAADVMPGFEDLIAHSRSTLTDLGLQVTDVDLRHYLDHSHVEELARLLAEVDLLWVNGGNVYYLRWLLRATGADRVITAAVAKGLVYGGSSAGAVVAGPTLDHFQPMDDPACAPDVVLEGLGLTDYVVVPHISHPQMGTDAEHALHHLTQDGYATLPLTDTQLALLTGQGCQLW